MFKEGNKMKWKVKFAAVAAAVFIGAAAVTFAADTDHRELNKMLTEVQVWPGLPNLTDDEKLINFAAYIAMYMEEDGWGAQGSKEAVEAILNRYFGVEKINHEKSELYRSWEDWDVDYPLDGVSPEVFEWISVMELRDIGNGMFSANADMYMAGSWDDSFLGPVSQWKLKSGAAILEGGPDDWSVAYESDNIVRFGKCELTLKPFVFKGADTWQIVSINGFEAPKVLFR
jgi:hypothetical protein